MSLEAIEQAIEKVALFNPGLGAKLKNMATSKHHLSGVARAAGGTAAVGAIGNVALGDKDQSIAERAIKGAAGGAIVGGGAAAGLKAYKANKGLANLKPVKPVANIA